ncbi:MAG: glycosyltransferase family 2 protein [Bacteroidales bacterium]
MASLQPRGPSVTVVIPALDEAASIGPVIDAIPRHVVSEILVVDGGSRDDTAAVATGCGARVVHQAGRGYGAACAIGMRAARGDVVVFLDADGACDPRDIARLIEPLATGVDMVLGSRLALGPPRGAMPWHQRFGNRLCAYLIRRLYPVTLTDLAPFRAVRRRALCALALEDLTYGWPTEMIVKAARSGWRIEEVPVRCLARTGGRSKISGTWRGTVGATSCILRTIVANARA